MKREDEAFHYLERSKARIMLDMLRNKAFVSQDKELNDLLARERSLRGQLKELISAPVQFSLRESEEGDAGDERRPESREEANPELERLQSELKSVVERIEQMNPDMASLVAVNPLRANEVQVLLDDETALLAYFIGAEFNEVFIVTRDKVTGLSLDVPRKKIIEKINDFRSQVSEGAFVKLYTSKDYEKALTELYEILIRPVEGQIAGKRHLVIVPHGMLHYLPFQALRSPDGRYLIESFTMSYLPSASVLKYAKLKNKGNHTDLFTAANPVTDLAPLPAAEVEAREVSALFERKMVVIGPVATKSKVKIEGPRYDFLLFSTHGEMIESDPLKSNLRFTATPEDDGKLTVSEIFDMEVKANLVTLSACETGLERGMSGDLPQGDDLVGLSRAFIHAGAPSVVASLWQVSDESTVAIMRSFFRNLKTMSKAEALRQSELELAKSSTQPYSHPFFWAPFILVGDWK
jgi:CHAT domain-containing protein